MNSENSALDRSQPKRLGGGKGRKFRRKTFLVSTVGRPSSPPGAADGRGTRLLVGGGRGKTLKLWAADEASSSFQGPSSSPNSWQQRSGDERTDTRRLETFMPFDTYFGVGPCWGKTFYIPCVANLCSFPGLLFGRRRRLQRRGVFPLRRNGYRRGGGGGGLFLLCSSSVGETWYETLV